MAERTVLCASRAAMEKNGRVHDSWAGLAGRSGAAPLQGESRTYFRAAAVKALEAEECVGSGGATALGQITSSAVSCLIRCLERRVTRMVRAFSALARIS